MRKIIENLEKIEIIVAANFAREYPALAMDVRRLVQESIQLIQEEAPAGVCTLERHKGPFVRGNGGHPICQECGADIDVLIESIQEVVIEGIKLHFEHRREIEEELERCELGEHVGPFLRSPEGETVCSRCGDVLPAGDVMQQLRGEAAAMEEARAKLLPRLFDHPAGYELPGEEDQDPEK